MIGLSFGDKLFISSKAKSDSVPITTLYGVIRSLIADPSAKNSGIETTIASTWDSSKIDLVYKAVPTGTVDFSTIILVGIDLHTLPIVLTTEKKAVMSVYCP